MGLDLDHLKPVHHESNDYFSIKELSTIPGYVEHQKQFIVEKDFDEFGKENVIYFKSEGSQRKGMRFSFYSDFKNGGIYCDLQSVKKAYNYLEADHISTLAELQSNFQKSFIDNFIQGESIFQVSW
jgi:hypothetical protein